MRHEQALLAEGATLVGGIDEVGVGAWAGPVAVGAVVLDPEDRIYKIRDSKLLDPGRREWLAARVRGRSLGHGVGLAWPNEIDEVGLSEAIRRAAARAVACLPVTPDAFLVDGKWNFLGNSARMVVRGDCESVSIAAASIVVKVARDRLMSALACMYPQYQFESNKGYPAPRHLWALSAYGPCPIHRLSFGGLPRAHRQPPQGGGAGVGGVAGMGRPPADAISGRAVVLGPGGSPSSKKGTP